MGTMAIIPQPWVASSALKWESNWNGFEVGHPERPVIGLYRSAGANVYMYVDGETNEIVEIWQGEEE